MQTPPQQPATMTLHEQVLFSFPSIALAQPHSAASVGYLVLSKTASCPELLRVQHTPDDTTSAHSTDCIVYREQKLQKVSPREYTLETEFGELTITFPELHHLIPQEDARIEIDNEVKKGITWEMIVRDFEKDINGWVTFEKNSYSLISSPFAGETSKGGNGKGKGDYMNAIQGPSYNGGSSSGWHDNVPYDPRDFNGSSTGYPDEKKNGGRLVLVDEDNGREIGETPMTAIDIIPGSHGMLHFLLLCIWHLLKLFTNKNQIPSRSPSPPSSIPTTPSPSALLPPTTSATPKTPNTPPHP
jgi:hypothetical protein